MYCSQFLFLNYHPALKSMFFLPKYCILQSIIFGFKVFCRIDNGYQIRLVGIQNPYSGRLEAAKRGTAAWGTVNAPNSLEKRKLLASIICRELFNTNQVSNSRRNSGASVSVNIGHVDCLPFDTRFSDCEASQQVCSRCSHSYDFHVVCQTLVGECARFKQNVCLNNGQCISHVGSPNFTCKCPNYYGGKFCETRLDTYFIQTRLVEGSSRYEGVVEVRRGDNSSWGTVCGDKFDPADASVVCRQLFNTNSKFYQIKDGSGKSLLNGLRCSGREHDLTECSGRWTQYCPTFYGVAAVRCEELVGSCAKSGRNVCKNGGVCSAASNSSAITCSCINGYRGRLCAEQPVISVRLSDGKTRFEGRIEVQRSNSNWGTVCDDAFDVKDANVICRSLFNTSASWYGVLKRSHRTNAINLDDLECSGEEHELSQCASSNWAAHDCRHDEDVSIRCEIPAGLVIGDVCRFESGEEKCLNEATCKPKNSKTSPFECECKFAYKGKFCETYVPTSFILPGGLGAAALCVLLFAIIRAFWIIGKKYKPKHITNYLRKRKLSKSKRSDHVYTVSDGVAEDLVDARDSVPRIQTSAGARNANPNTRDLFLPSYEELNPVAENEYNRKYQPLASSSNRTDVAYERPDIRNEYNRKYQSLANSKNRNDAAYERPDNRIDPSDYNRSYTPLEDQYDVINNDYYRRQRIDSFEMGGI